MTSAPLRALAALAISCSPVLAADPVLILGQSPEGLTAPGGLVIDDAGRIWVSDAAKGLCRVIPGAPQPLVASPFCQAVGGAPDLRPGPVKPAGLAFDPGTRTFFQGDGGALTGGLWRLPLDVNGNIDPLGVQKFLTLPFDRVFGVSYGGQGGAHIDYVTKLAPGIFRVQNPATCAAPCGGSGTVGSAAAPEGLVELDGALYIADEHDGAVWIPTPGQGNTAAQPLFPGDPSVPGAVAVDPVNDRVYFAMAEETGGDRIDVLDLNSGIRDIYVDGPTTSGRFAAVTALAVEPNGDLLIADDPAVAAGAEGAGGVGTAMLYRAAFGPIAAPRVTYTGGPTAITAAPTVGVSFRSRAGAAFSCRVDGGVWAACGTGPSGTFAVGPLADGAHTIDVQAQDSFGIGPIAHRSFAVDTRPPVAKVDNAATDRTALDGFFTLRFSADEAATFQCAASGTSFRPCEDGWRLAGLAPGAHRLTVRAVDTAGNVGPVAAWEVSSTPSAGAVMRVSQIAGTAARVEGAFERSQRNLRIARAACRKVGGRLVTKRVLVTRNGKRVRVPRLICQKPKKKLTTKSATKAGGTTVRRKP